MIFNEQHLVIIESLEPNEAKAFVKFLESEIIRHEDDICQAQDLINRVLIKFGGRMGNTIDDIVVKEEK